MTLTIENADAMMLEAVNNIANTKPNFYEVKVEEKDAIKEELESRIADFEQTGKAYTKEELREKMQEMFRQKCDTFAS